jgi:signal transduction histidine kinase
MESEREKLIESNVALKQVDDELQLRLDQERIDRVAREWLSSTIRSISSQFKSTIVPDTIAESLVESLGRALGVDIVLFYSFPNFPMQRIWKQWHPQADAGVEESMVVENESDLFQLVESLWNKKRSIVVNDSHLINVSQDPVPKLAAMSQMRARSWVMVPLGTGSQVLGCLGVGMFENPRVWSAAEIELIQKVVSEVAEVFIQARLFRQSMQIVENDAEVHRLVELDKVKNDFIENMNHELRTPLASIIGYLEVIMDDVDARAEPELVSSLTAVQRNAVRLQSLIENMMRISRTDFQNFPLVVSTVDVGHLLGDVVNSLHLGAEDSGVKLTLRLDSPAGDFRIDGDINQLEQVFVNLMSNAVKFTPRGGTVTIVARRAHAAGDFVEVKVTDTGIGIPPREFPNVFKRFFRASTATQASIPGFGIGLSLVHSIVREHHGTITFDSKVGKGTVFTVTLPARYVATTPADETT